MGDNIVYLVHGMGVFENGWETSWKNAIIAEANKYAGVKNNINSLKFYPVTYYPVIKTILTRWQQDSSSLTPVLSQADPDMVAAVKWLNNAGSTTDFGWTNVACVVLYRFFSIYRDAILSNILSQMAPYLLDTLDNHSIIAHSLGTAVIHEALCHLANDPSTKNIYGPPSFRFSNMISIANVSQLLSIAPNDPSTSVVRPGVASDQSYFDLFLNFHHQLDPIPQLLPFKGFPGSSSSSQYQSIQLTQIQGKQLTQQNNPHAFEDYIADPGTHIPIFQILFGPSCITSKESSDSIANFKQSNPTSTQSDLSNIINSASTIGPKDWQKVISYIVSSFKAMK
jgi:hypothetical protein